MNLGVGFQYNIRVHHSKKTVPDMPTAKIAFNEFGTPYSEHFDDVYFSNQDGLAETNYVFLDKNRLSQRWQFDNQPQAFHIAETGFGTGLNFLAAWQAFNRCFETHNGRPKLRFSSFEKFPLSKADLKQTLANWPELSDLSQQLLEQYPAMPSQDTVLRLQNDDIELTLLIGDVNERIQSLDFAPHLVDAWFLDGFAPSKNPDMWTQNLFDHMARLTNIGGSLATFTAAGFVRRGLQQAGFSISKHKGFGFKREMLSGTKRESYANES